MKRLIKKYLVFGVVALMLGSCKKDEVKSVAAANGTGATLTASTTEVMPERATQDADLITISFTKPDFGFQSAEKNIFQLAVAGTNFSAPKEVPFDTKVLTKTYTGLEFNQLLLALNLPFDAATEVEVRVKSEVSSSIAPLYSNVITLSAKPYPLITRVYVPGDYQGWSPPTADSLTSATGNGIHTGIINFAPGGTFEFKITPQKTWDLAYGKGANDTTMSADGAAGNLKVPAAGPYFITVNTNLLSIHIDKHSWGIIGSATPTGWDSDTDMAYDNPSDTYSLTLNLKVGEIKFRLNDDWGTNLGGSDGTLTLNGANIAIAEAGDYRIVLNTFNNTYTITKL